jgi:nucleoside-diphosphate-sugar epimerase
MTFPSEVRDETELEDLLAEPSEADVESVRRLGGDVLVIGAAGKMGPSLARRIRRAIEQAGVRSQVVAASRFSTPAVREKLEAAGVHTIACDLLDDGQISALPRAANVLFLAGRKFGTVDRSDVTWVTNTIVPARVAEHFALSRMVVFSTGNVYPLVPVEGPGSREADPPSPAGEYAQSCLGRERVIEFVSRERHLRALIFRLNYAVDLRYGTIVDIARKVLAGKPIDLSMGFFNAIWQGDANSYALRSLELCASPPAVLNVTGAERISVRDIAEWFGSRFGRSPVLVNTEGPVALLSDSTRCRTLLGEPQVAFPVLRQWVAQWVANGGASLNRPTHFEVTDGRY